MLTSAAAREAVSSRSATDGASGPSRTLRVSGSLRLVWLARLWRCREPTCRVAVFTEEHDLVPPRAKVTSRAAAWATDALTFDDTTVSALARHLGVDWHTCWDAVEATRRLVDPARLDGVDVLGVDEHVVRHEALLFRMEVRPASLGRRSGWVKLAAVWPGGTPGVDGSRRDKVRAVRHFRTGRAW